MKGSEAGFGLIELMVALGLGLLLIAGAAQIFVSARETYLAQQSSAMAQEDARFVLSKMAQEIRMVGMFGCQAHEHIIDAPSVFQTPISWQGMAGSRSWRFISADVGRTAGKPDWTVVSDCKRHARAYPGQFQGLTPDQTAFAVRQIVYWFEHGQLKVGAGRAVLLDNVADFDISFGLACSPAGQTVTRYEASPNQLASIRSVRLSLTLRDPRARVKDQTYHMVVALRNRLG